MSEEVDITDTPFSRPSIFEIVAHESVAAVFKPAFQYVLKILAQKYPDKLGIFCNYADEIYMFCDLFLQRHYLNYHNASVSENFYYLKRVDISGRTLNPKLRRFSLFSLVVLPYIKGKLDKMFENLRDKTIREGTEHSSEQGRIMMVFLKIYPYVHFILGSPFVLYQLGYILDLISFHNPIFHAVGIQLVRANSEDLLHIPLITLPSSGSVFQKMMSLPSFFLDKFIRFIAVTMPVTIFFLQFLEWWYSTEYEMTSPVTRSPIPPPPESPKVSEIGCGLPPHPLQCPLCHKVHNNMAALVSTGFVFCYPCIHQYVMEHGSCPVTQIPSSLDQILRIYSLRET